jgi:glycosyltransferase involved in cell wall biosynthesis
LKDILYLGMDEWNAVSKRPRQLATQLARTHRVFYLNPCYYSLWGYARDTLRRRRIRRRYWGVEKITSSLYVVDLPPLFPKGMYYPTLGHVNYGLLLPLIRHRLRELRLHDFILWLSVPPDQWLIGKLGEQLSVYDCMDRYAYFFDGPTRQRVEAEERRMFERVDLVLASSAALQTYCGQHHDDVHLAPNAVDLDLFAPQIIGPADTLASVSGPIIGYVGYVAQWFDLELAAAVARAYPQTTLVLVGPVIVDTSVLQQLPNVILLGERPYPEIAAFVQRFDVCLIPFQVNELTRAVNPIKLYEYFALGKPVVATPLPELDPFRDLLYIGETADAFIAQVAAALDEADRPDPQQVEARKQIAHDNSWQARATQIDQILEPPVPPT